MYLHIHKRRFNTALRPGMPLAVTIRNSFANTNKFTSLNMFANMKANTNRLAITKAPADTKMLI